MHPRISDSCRPMLVMGSACIALAIATIFTFLNIQTQSIEYSTNTIAQIFLAKGTHHMYIQIDKFHQNNLRYTKSINYNQLKGETKNLNLKDSAPFNYKNNKPYYPAGEIANTYFQDVIRLQGLEIQENNISWKKELQIIGITNYKANEILIPESWTPSTNEGSVPLNTTAESELPILNERFVNWIYLSTFAKFRKLWGSVTVPADGYYTLEIESIFDLSGKSIYFTEPSWLGPKNWYLTALLFLIGIASIVVSIVLSRISDGVNAIN